MVYDPQNNIKGTKKLLYRFLKLKKIVGFSSRHTEIHDGRHTREQ
jgi:hypothetical protein